MMKVSPVVPALMLALAVLTGQAASAGPPAAPETQPPDDAAGETVLDFLAPVPERLNPGLAGDDPADIARYLMAGGVTSAGLSPTGELIAYVSSVTGTRQLWLVPAGGGQSRQMTFSNGITFFRWMPDGRSLIYGADNDGNEQESYTRISVDGKSETVLLPATQGGFRTFGDVSDDGHLITFASTERNGDDYDIYVADLRQNDIRRIFEGRAGFFARAFSPDGSLITVAETVGEDADNLYLLETATGKLTLLSAPGTRSMHTAAGISWLPDGSGFYLATNLFSEFTAPYFFDISDRSFNPVAETERDIDQIGLCGRDAGWVVWTENHDGFHQLRLHDRTTARTRDVASLPEGIYQFSCSPLTDRVAVHVSGWKTPGDILTVDLSSGTHQTVVSSNYAGLDPERLVRPQSIRFTARDGIELQGLLYLPDARSRHADGAPPVIFDIHGGPTAQSVASFDPVAQYHVDNGLAVFQPNVRGSSGFGRTYMTLDDRRRRLDSVRDLIDLLEGLRKTGLVDTSRAAVMGGSYGGYMVNAVLAMYPDVFRAGVSLYGVADWVTALTYVSPSLRASDLIEYGDITEAEWLEFYTENSPIRLADRIRVPVLFSHGVMDPRIDIAETEVMVKALRDRGVPAPYIRIPDEGHGWRKLSNRLYYYRQEARFLKEVLGVEEAEQGR